MRGAVCSRGVTSLLTGLVLLVFAAFATVSAQTRQTGVLTATQLRAQIEAALAVGNTSSAAEYFQTLVARFPAALIELPFDDVGRLVSALPSGANGQPRRAALEALFSLRWKRAYTPEPSGYWLALVEMRLKDSDLGGARAAAARITDPAQLIRLYVSAWPAPIVCGKGGRYWALEPRRRLISGRTSSVVAPVAMNRSSAASSLCRSS